MDAQKKPLHEQPVSPATLLPINVIQVYDDTAWEQFVVEWLDGAEPKYAWFDRVGGAGDKGRDIVAYTTAKGTPGPLDIFQCKHYAHPLMPGDAWLELGKLCVYTWKNVYPAPRRVLQARQPALLVPLRPVRHRRRRDPVQQRRLS